MKSKSGAYRATTAVLRISATFQLPRIGSHSWLLHVRSARSSNQAFHAKTTIEYINCTCNASSTNATELWNAVVVTIKQMLTFCWASRWTFSDSLLVVPVRNFLWSRLHLMHSAGLQFIVRAEVLCGCIHAMRLNHLQHLSICNCIGWNYHCATFPASLPRSAMHAECVCSSIW